MEYTVRMGGALRQRKPLRIIRLPTYQSWTLQPLGFSWSEARQFKFGAAPAASCVLHLISSHSLITIGVEYWDGSSKRLWSFLPIFFFVSIQWSKGSWEGSCSINSENSPRSLRGPSEEHSYPNYGCYDWWHGRHGWHGYLKTSCRGREMEISITGPRKSHFRGLFRPRPRQETALSLEASREEPKNVSLFPPVCDYRLSALYSFLFFDISDPPFLSRMLWSSISGFIRRICTSQELHDAVFLIPLTALDDAIDFSFWRPLENDFIILL